MSEVEIVKPTLEDVESIFNLIEYFAKRGDILKRPKDNIAERIREFFCARHNGKIVGIVSLRIFFPYLAEVRTLAIKEDYQGKNIGRRLIEACIEEARNLRVRNVFALTFKKDFFLKLGFNLIDKKSLPSKKIWDDCINCPFFPDCGEEAVILSVKPAEK